MTDCLSMQISLPAQCRSVRPRWSANKCKLKQVSHSQSSRAVSLHSSLMSNIIFTFRIKVSLTLSRRILSLSCLLAKNLYDPHLCLLTRIWIFSRSLSLSSTLRGFYSACLIRSQKLRHTFPSILARSRRVFDELIRRAKWRRMTVSKKRGWYVEGDWTDEISSGKRKIFLIGENLYFCVFIIIRLNKITLTLNEDKIFAWIYFI